MNTNTIQSPNSSGQGFCPTHSLSIYHALAVKFGYTYSHSTPCKYPDGKTLVWHTYKFGEHNLSFADHPCARWSTSCSSASGRQYTGSTYYELSRHLASKRRRYAELR